MNRLTIFVIVCAVAGLAAQATQVVRTFDGDPAGRPPPGLRFAELRGAADGRWRVERDGTDGVLLHSGGAAGARGFALALLEGPALGELEAAVRVRMLGGHGAAGLVWRYKDPDNHYLAELSLTDQTLAFYRLVHGNRVRVEDEDDLELDVTAWHTLRIRHGSERVRVYLGGVRVFEARDRTFREPGAVGVWASDDATVQFDDFRVEDRQD